MDEDDCEDLFDAYQSDECLQHGSSDTIASPGPVGDFSAEVSDHEGASEGALFTHNMSDYHRVNNTENDVEHTDNPSGYAESVQAANHLQITATPKIRVLAKIELVFEEMADVLLNERGQMSILLKRRTKGSGSNRKEASISRGQSTSKPITFPGKTEKEAWQFTVLTRILEMMHEAVRSDVVLSKRDIYYRDPALFGKQAHVDRFVDDVACTFGVSRSALGVTAVAKGLIAGAVKFCRRDGSSLDATADHEGTLVPSLRDVLSADMCLVKWILVIEKEATFRSIAASQFWDTVTSFGIMITAKGYPDIATRAMIRFLCNPSPRNNFAAPPIFALVDYDPDGLAIYSTYKHGSIGLAHESANLNIPQLQWLGMCSGQIISKGDDSQVSQGLLTLSDRDRKRARCMLAWEALASEAEIRRELQIMLMLNVKAELQILDARPGGMGGLLKRGLL